MLIGLLLFVSAPFWSVSESVIGDSSYSAYYDSLPEDVQNELFWKRTVIDAVDAARDINSALGFHDPDLGIGGKTLVVGAWAFSAGTTYFVQRGWTSVFRAVTPSHFRPRNKTAFKNMKQLIGQLFDQEVELKKAEAKLSSLKTAAWEAGKKAEAEKAQAAKQTETVKTAADTDKPVQTEEKVKTAAGGADKPVQTEEKVKTAAGADKPVQTEGTTARSMAETRRLGKKLRRKRPAGAGTTAPSQGVATQPAVQTAQEKAVERQKLVVDNLNKKVQNTKSQLKKAKMVRLKGIVSRIGYGAGHTVRWTAVPGLYLAGGLVQAALAGDAVMILFDKTEDLDNLREQYMEDIEFVVNEAASFMQ